MPAPTTPAFDAFIASLPDAPSSDAPRHEETPPDPKDPPARGPGGKFAAKDAPPGAPEDADSPPPAPRKESAPRAKPATVEPTTPTGTDPDPKAVLQALRDGDLDTIADLLGEDPAGFDERTPKWAARQRKEAKLIAERDSVTKKAELVVERWSPVSRLVAAREANPAALFELVELLTGQDPDQAWTAAIRARGSVDPRVPTLAKAVEERDQRLATYEAERAARADAAFYETLRDEVDAKAVVRQIDEWESKVANVLRESLDADTGEPRLSTKQAADRVVRREREEYERRAKVFAGDDAPRTRAKRERAPERAAGLTGSKIRKLSKEEWLSARSKDP